jgi:hypothetical protein
VNLASEAAGIARFAATLRQFLATPASPRQAADIIARGMERREVAFIEKLRSAIFATSRSPYLALLRAARCELGDIEHLVRQHGIEATLERLRQAGVYVTFDEFKGHVPIVRGDTVLRARDRDFDNPVAVRHFTSSTGGTSGRARRIMIDLAHLGQMAPHWALWFLEHRVATAPLVFVGPSYPAAVNHQLICAKFGNRFVKWFCTGQGGSLAYRALSAALQGLVRWAGGFPKPDYVTLGETDRIATFLAGLAERGEPPCVNAAPSTAVRIALAARARGIPLSGVTFLLGGEALTAERRAAIEASGALVTTTYGFSEGGNVGNQCRQARHADEVHVSLDAYAVIGSRGPETRAWQPILLTALRPAAAKVLLNTEIGDGASIEWAPCTCRFGALGYRQRLHTIRSLEKLTGEGVTFRSADVYRVLEEVLPRRFGGGVADYQLIEEQSDEGLPRYRLLVSPAVGTVDETALVATFYGELALLQRAYPFMVDQWAQTSALRVERQPPVASDRGKALPVVTLGKDHHRR